MTSSSHKLRSKYHVGEVLTVKVVERIDATCWIVSLGGTLIQVKNTTPIPLQEGETVRMQVTSLHPPQLSLELQ